MKIKLYKIAIAVLAAGAFSAPAYAGVKASVDTDRDGKVSLDEFVIFNAEKDLRQRDRNKDGEFSTQEWNGKAQGGYRPAMLKRFDANADGTMDAAEVVEVYSFAFGKRDKNGDGSLSGNEIPKPLMAK